MSLKNLNSTVSSGDSSQAVTYQQAVRQNELQIQPQTSNAARIARKVASVAFAAFGSLGVLLALTAFIFTILATHGIGALLAPVAGKAAMVALWHLATTVAPITTYAACTALGLSALGGATSLALKE